MSRVALICLLAVAAPGPSAQVLPSDPQPRQPAILLDGVRAPGIEVPCQLPVNRQFFDQGMAHLLAHAYLEAERDFRQVITTEPDIAMAYWGMAMANFARPDRAADLTEQALLFRDKAAAGHRRWIDALAACYEVDQESANRNRELKQKQGYYAELPARRFTRTAELRDRALTAALRQLVDARPEDPLARLLLTDGLCRGAALPPAEIAAADRQLAPVDATPLGRFARLQRLRLWLPVDPGRVAPVDTGDLPPIAEVWHLAGRSFAARHDGAKALHCFDEAARLWHARMLRFRMMPYRDPGYATLLGDLGDCLVKLGLHGRILELAERVRGFARHPVLNQQGNPEHLAGLSPLWIIGYAGRYDDPALLEQWEDAGWLDAGRHRRGAVRIAAELALAYARTGRQERAESWRTRLRGLRADAWTGSDARRIDRWIAQVEAWAAVLRGDRDAAAVLSQTEMAPLDQALCWERLGDPAKALAAYEVAVHAAPGDVALQVRRVALLLTRVGKDRTRAALESWRSSAPPLPSPFLDRTAEVVRACDLDPVAFWAPPPGGPHPDESVPLGPDHWQPFPARDFALPGLDGKPVPLSRYAGTSGADGREPRPGRPFVVILYLGFGCIHCVEQLRSFHPHVQGFRAAGLEILAIGTDSVKNMQESMRELPADERFAYTMLSDRKMRVFREWVAYDFFGQMPMHGTYLVGADGRILFQDISHEPFDHPEWLLAECRRLLAR